MYISATQLVSTIGRDTSIDDAFGIVASDPARYGTGVPLLVDNYSEIVFLSIEGELVVDRRDEVLDFRSGEISIVNSGDDEMWIDAKIYAQKSARREAVLTLAFIVAISYLIVVFNWLISRFAVRLSGALNTLARSVEERDAYTRMHSKNVAGYAESVARHMSLSKQDQLVIRIAGELHDIGMIGVPQDILGKSDKLSTLEHDLMKRHADEGASILHHLIDFDAVIQAARYHHEQFDGSGYPEGRKGVDIPRTARLIAICDVWDALTTDRPYRDAFEIGEARSILMKGSGTQFDPEILLSFVDSVIEKK